MAKKNDVRNIILALFLIFTVLKIIAHIYQDSRFWAFNHFNFLPFYYALIFGLISMAVIAILYTESGGRISDKLVKGFNHSFFNSDSETYFRLIFISVCTVIFIIFLAPTHFLGDGYTWLDNLTGQRSTIFKWSESGSTSILSFIQNFLGEKNKQTGLLAFQIVSVTSGAITIWFYFEIAGLISSESTKRFLIFISLLISGTLLLFFGYVENYPILFPFIFAFFYFAIKYAKKDTGIIGATIFLILAIIIHLQSAIFIPGLIYLYFCNPSGQKLFKKYKAYFYLSIIIILTAGLYIFYKKYTTNLYFENIFLPLFNGKPIYPEYSLLSGRHLIDIINQLLLISPLLPLFAILSIKNWRKSLADKTSAFLILISISSLLFLLIIDPKLGMPRDWDLFAMTGIGVMLLFIYRITDPACKKIKPYSFSLLLIALLAITPFLIVSLNTSCSLKQMRYIIELDKEKSLSSIITLRNYHRDNGNKNAADSANMLFNLYNQNERKINQAFKALDDGNYEQAATIMKAIKPDKFNSNYHNLASILNMEMGFFDNALKANAKAIQLRAYDAKIISNRAQIYIKMKNYNEAMELLRKGLAFDSTCKSIVEGLAYTHYQYKRYDSAYYYAVALARLPEPDFEPFYLMARTAAEGGQKELARRHIEYYLEYCLEDPKFEMRSEKLKTFLDNMGQ
ncbi:MAG: hypothetical protein ABIJ45_07580 [Candidatus Zixiibacteriota bacterium]